MKDNDIPAIKKVLTAQYAANYVYEIIGPILDTGPADLANQYLWDYYLANDDLIYLINASNGTLTVPATSYELPYPADSSAHGIKLAIAAENDCIHAYIFLLQNCHDEDYKKFAISQLNSATIRLAQWNKYDHNYPVIDPLPGQNL